VRNWYSIQAKAEDSVAEIALYGVIGQSFWNEESVSAKQFLDAIGKLPDNVKNVRVRINSPGGNIFDGIAIANTLRDQRLTKNRVIDVIVDGLAGSIASVIAMAGNTITMGDNALMFVHDPWGCGNATQMRKMADDFDLMRDQIVATYQWQSTLSDEEIKALMAAETWLDPDEAIEKGFATAKVEGLKAAATLDPRAIADMAVPEKYRARVEALVTKPAEAPTAAAAADILRLCREGECLDLAEGLVGAHATLETVNTAIAKARDVRASAALRTSEINALCAAAKLPELAGSYDSGGMTVDAVRAQLTTITAKLDRIEIDGSLPVDAKNAKKPVIDTTAIYAELNNPKR
jgi:ATP-dependent Clp protease protease subunit